MRRNIPFIFVLIALCAFGCKKSAPTAPETAPDNAKAQRPFSDGFFYVVNDDDSVTITGMREPAPEVLIIPDTIEGRTVTTVAEEAFKDLRAIKFVVFSESITNIGREAFADIDLIAAWLPAAVPTIGENAFPLTGTTYVPYSAGNIPPEYVDALASPSALPFTYTEGGVSPYTGTEWFVYLPPAMDGQPLTLIGSNTFMSNMTLTRLFAPSVTRTEAGGNSGGNPFGAFCEARALTNVAIPNLTNVGAYSFYYCHTLSNASFPLVTDVNSDGFRYSGLTNIHLPSVTNLGYGAFYQCPNLVSINSLQNLVYIGQYAFKYCNQIKNVSLTNAVTVAWGAFELCYNIKSVSLPNATTIGYHAFANCYALTTIDIPKVTTFETGAFYDCGVITVSNTAATTLGWNTFYGCAKLEDAYLPNVTLLTGGNFKNCLSLTNVELGATTSIGMHAFQNTHALQTLTLKNAAAPALVSDPFLNTTNSKTLYVPIGATGYDSWTSHGFTIIEKNV